MEKYQFIESVIRREISMICKDYSEVNKKFLKSYDPSKPAAYIVCLDANKLHGHYMIQLLLIEILDQVNPEKNKLDNYRDDASFLEVDLDYPDKLHDLQNDCPLAHEKIKDTIEMFSEYQLQIIEKNEFSFDKNAKLIPNLGNKKKCKLRYRNGKLYLELRLKF